MGRGWKRVGHLPRYRASPLPDSCISEPKLDVRNARALASQTRRLRCRRSQRCTRQCRSARLRVEAGTQLKVAPQRMKLLKFEVGNTRGTMEQVASTHEESTARAATRVVSPARLRVPPERRTISCHASCLANFNL